jgi:hypothetical protein
MALMVTLTHVAQAQQDVAMEGRWEGVLEAGPNKLRLVVNISKAADGIYLGTMTSVDQGNVSIAIDSIQNEGNSLRLELKAIMGVYEGLISPDKTKITGKWMQGGPALPLEFRRVDSADSLKETEKPVSAPRTSETSDVSPLPVELAVPFVPTPVMGGQKIFLAYELHITNFSPVEIQLGKLEVLSAGVPVATFEGAELNGLLQRPGAPNLPDNRALGTGLRAIAFLWIGLDAGKPVPASLRHRLTSATGRTVEGMEMQISSTQPLVIWSPLRGDNWLASSGPGSTAGHRQALMLIEGKLYLAQRLAIDWIRLNADNKTFSGDERDNKSYRAYGAEAFAVADGVIASVKDGIPENIPGATSRAVPITLDTVCGNYVVLDLGDDRFAFYAHLQPGSLRVKVGDRVRRGQVLGLVGNSGNSTQPHLHFHVTNGNSPLGAEGIPYAIESFEVQAQNGSWESKKNEIPMNNSRVRF